MMYRNELFYPTIDYHLLISSHQKLHCFNPPCLQRDFRILHLQHTQLPSIGVMGRHQTHTSNQLLTPIDLVVFTYGSNQIAQCLIRIFPTGWKCRRQHAVCHTLIIQMIICTCTCDFSKQVYHTPKTLFIIIYFTYTFEHLKHIDVQDDQCVI